MSQKPNTPGNCFLVTQVSLACFIPVFETVRAASYTNHSHTFLQTFPEIFSIRVALSDTTQQQILSRFDGAKSIVVIDNIYIIDVQYEQRPPRRPSCLMYTNEPENESITA